MAARPSAITPTGSTNAESANAIEFSLRTDQRQVRANCERQGIKAMRLAVECYKSRCPWFDVTLDVISRISRNARS